MTEPLKLVYALNNEIRFQILSLLVTRNYYACEIPKIIKKSQPAVSHHLSKLLHLGIVGVKKIGKKRSYYITNEKVKKVIHALKNSTKTKIHKNTRR